MRVNAAVSRMMRVTAERCSQASGSKSRRAQQTQAIESFFGKSRNCSNIAFGSAVTNGGKNKEKCDMCLEEERQVVLALKRNHVDMSAHSRI